MNCKRCSSAITSAEYNNLCPDCFWCHEASPYAAGWTSFNSGEAIWFPSTENIQAVKGWLLGFGEANWGEDRGEKLEDALLRVSAEFYVQLAELPEEIRKELDLDI